MSVVASASASLALVKYWGKLPYGTNLPATPSLAISLNELRTVTRITEVAAEAPGDSVHINGRPCPPQRFTPMIDRFREIGESTTRILVESDNTFPTAAGLASSSSGFAALAIGLDAFYRTRLSRSELSAEARQGSGSACRSVYGGFTAWERGADHAEQIHTADHWPQLRLLIVVLTRAEKPVSSRQGMNATAATSPVYRMWCDESQRIYDRARTALDRRDLDALGTAMRESYLFMFSTMFTSRPPLIYWLPESLAVIREAEDMRRLGIPVWETMDAGPQVKLLTVEDQVPAVSERLRTAVPQASILVSSVGGEPEAGDV